MASSAAALPGLVSRVILVASSAACGPGVLMIGALLVAVSLRLWRSPAFSPVPCLFVRATFKSCWGCLVALRVIAGGRRQLLQYELLKAAAAA